MKKIFNTYSIFLLSVALFLKSTFAYSVTFSVGVNTMSFDVNPTVSITGNYELIWSNLSGGIPQISEVINGQKIPIVGGSKTGSFPVTGRSNGRYEYVLELHTPGTGTGLAVPPVRVFVDVIRSINVDRSLIIHDTATLNAADFSLLSVMNTLASQMSAAGGDSINGTQLFARMWDAQNPPSNSANTGIQNCTGSLNNFPVECRPVEGAQASTAASSINSYVPIALVNRFDLRDKVSGQDCGEYRIVFGRPSGARNLIIFEAQVPNPTPGNLQGCKAIQNMWAELTNQSSASVRASTLRSFYFSGIPSAGVRAPIDRRNFLNSTGQIRTNQFMGLSWNLKEYKVAVENGRNTLQVVTVKSNPVGNLFDATNPDSRAAAFQNNFVANMDTLLLDIDNFALVVANNAHNNGQSHANTGLANENAYLSHFTRVRGSAFESQIRSKLSAANSNLSPEQVMNRATAMTCGGCHRPEQFGLTTAGSIGPGQSWPRSIDFVHVREVASSGIFPLSPALLNQFLPARKRDMESYLNAPTSAPAATSTTTNQKPAATSVINSKRSG